MQDKNAKRKGQDGKKTKAKNDKEKQTKNKARRTI